MRTRQSTVVLVIFGLLALGSAGTAPEAAATGWCSRSALTLPAGTLIGTPGDDVMRGTDGPDTMKGLGGNDIICGGDGDDIIYGGGGSDTLLGEKGNDRLYGQTRCDNLIGGSGNDVLVPGKGGVDCTGLVVGDNGNDRIVLSFVGFYDIYGGWGRDTLDISKMTYEMTVDLRNHAFSPSYYPNTESRVHEIEKVFGSPQADHLYGDDLSNVLQGRGGDDFLHGLGGDDRLIGGAGHDQVDGGDGHDVCEGEELWSCND